MRVIPVNLAEAEGAFNLKKVDIARREYFSFHDLGAFRETFTGMGLDVISRILVEVRY